jgi:FkbM family methyltransferase
MKALTASATTEIDGMRAVVPEMDAATQRLSKVLDRPYFYLGNNTGLTTTVFGQKIFVDTRDTCLTPHIVMDGEWEMWITSVFRSIVRQGMTVVDIGANCGWYTLLGANLVGSQGKVYAFEPNSDCCTLLKKTLSVNGLSDRVTVVEQGVVEASGERTFYKPPAYNASAAFHPLRQDNLGEIESTAIPCTSLDDYFRPLDYPAIDVIKIDAEGSEPMVIQGAQAVLRSNPRIRLLIEYWSSHRAAMESLVALGFRMAVILETSEIIPISVNQLDCVEPAQMILCSR